jgi:hypothetical protein
MHLKLEDFVDKRMIVGKDRGGLFRLKELMMGKRIPFRLDLILQRLAMDPLGEDSYRQVQNLLMSH